MVDHGLDMTDTYLLVMYREKRNVSYGASLKIVRAGLEEILEALVIFV